MSIVFTYRPDRQRAREHRPTEVCGGLDTTWTFTALLSSSSTSSVSASTYIDTTCAACLAERVRLRSVSEHRIATRQKEDLPCIYTDRVTRKGMYRSRGERPLCLGRLYIHCTDRACIEFSRGKRGCLERKENTCLPLQLPRPYLRLVGEPLNVFLQGLQSIQQSTRMALVSIDVTEFLIKTFLDNIQVVRHARELRRRKHKKEEASRNTPVEL